MPIFMKFEGIEGDVCDSKVQIWGQAVDGRLIFPASVDIPGEGTVRPATMASIESLMADPERLLKGFALLVPVRIRSLFERVKISKGILPYFLLTPPGQKMALRVDGGVVERVEPAGDHTLIGIKPQAIIAILIG